MKLNELRKNLLDLNRTYKQEVRDLRKEVEKELLDELNKRASEFEKQKDTFREFMKQELERLARQENEMYRQRDKALSQKDLLLRALHESDV